MTDYKLEEAGVFDYERPQVKNGYTDHTLHIDLSGGAISVKPVDERTKEVFVGGRGYNLWLLWQAVSGETRWNDPDNAVCIVDNQVAVQEHIRFSGGDGFRRCFPVRFYRKDGHIRTDPVFCRS